MIFKDGYSGWCEIQLLKQKSEVPKAFKIFSSKMEADTNKKIKVLRSDGGGEYCSKDFRDWLANSGIIHRITPPYTPQLNGVAERSNRTIVESARSQMYGKKVPLELWGLAVQCAVYVQNRTTSCTNSKTPLNIGTRRNQTFLISKSSGAVSLFICLTKKEENWIPKQQRA